MSKWCIVFAGIGAGAIVMGMLQQYGFACMGQRLTRRLRVLLFSSMFCQACPHLRPCRLYICLFIDNAVTNFMAHGGSA